MELAPLSLSPPVAVPASAFSTRYRTPSAVSQHGHSKHLAHLCRGGVWRRRAVRFCRQPCSLSHDSGAEPAHHTSKTSPVAKTVDRFPRHVVHEATRAVVRHDILDAATTATPHGIALHAVVQSTQASADPAAACVTNTNVLVVISLRSHDAVASRTNATHKQVVRPCRAAVYRAQTAMTCSQGDLQF